MSTVALPDARAALGSAREGGAAAFEAAFGTVPDRRYVFNNYCGGILDVAREMMHGEIAYRRGDMETAFERLRRTVDLDDNLA